MIEERREWENEEIESAEGYNDFETYKENGRKNKRILSKPNSFKKKINALISSEKKNKPLYRTMKIMFTMCHASAHEDFLLKHLEDESNYYRNLNNIKKAKVRSLIEILDANVEELELKLNKHNNPNSRKWDLVAEIQRGELTIRTVVPFKKVKDFIGDEDKLEETDVEKDGTFLSDRELDKQQYFQLPLRETLDKLDKETLKLIRHKTEARKKNLE